MKKNLTVSLIIIAVLALFHCLLFVWPSELMAVYINILRPLFFLLAAVVSFFALGGIKVFDKTKNNTFLICCIASALYVFLMLFTGILGKFGQNIMVPDFLALVKNLWIYGIVFASIEFIRLNIIRRVPAKYSSWFDLILASVLAFVSIDNIRTMFTYSNVAEQIALVIVPALLISFFLTYAAGGGTFGGLLIFRFSLTMIPYVMPIVPDVNRFLMVIFVCVVVFASYLILGKYRYEERQRTIQKKEKFRWRGYLVPLVLLCVLVAFGAGLFPVKPVAVASDSMSATFEKGSVVMIEKLKPQKAAEVLKVGDVIEFVSGSRSLVHRIHEVKADGVGNVYYVTKGDSNNAPDTRPVYPEDIRGVGHFYIPFIGYPAVWLSGAG
ncbi:MAG: signal peptidase I [Firmicutes bacterium]|nr:signal peptidase I [Bacillota bacterium]